MYASSKTVGDKSEGFRSAVPFFYEYRHLSKSGTILRFAAAIVFGSIVAYYLLFVMFGYLFVLAMCYTVVM